MAVALRPRLVRKPDGTRHEGTYPSCWTRSWVDNQDVVRIDVLHDHGAKEPMPANFTSQDELEQRSGDDRLETLSRELEDLRSAAKVREAHTVETLRQMDAMVCEAEDKKRAVEASHAELAHANAFINRVTESMGEVLIVLDLEGRVRDVNQRYVSLLGRSRDEVTGRAFAELVADAPADPRLLAGRIEGSLDGSLWSADGDRVPHLLRIAPLYRTSGKREGAVVVGTDVRLQRQAQRERELAYDKVSNLLNHMRQAVFVVLADGEIIEPVSRHTSALFGGDIRGRNVFDVLYGDLARESDAFLHLELAFETCFGTEQFQWELMAEQFPRRIVRKAGLGPDDELRILKAEYGPLRDGEGLMDRLMVVVEDVTKVELLEREQRVGERRTQMLEELARNRLEDLATFFASAYEQLRESRRALERGDAASQVVLFRQLHTLKGNARVLGLTLVAQATHEVETLATQLRERAPDAAGQPAAVREGIAAAQGALAEYSDVAARILHLRNDLESKSLDDLHRATLALDAELAALLASLGTGSDPRPHASALERLAVTCRDAAEAGGSDDVRLAAKALEQTLRSLFDGANQLWPAAVAALPGQRAALNELAIQRRLGSSALSAYTLATATWTALYLDAYALAAAHERLGRGDDRERELREIERACERATYAASSLHAEYVSALLGRVLDCIAARTVQLLPEIGRVLRELWRHLALHSSLETQALLRTEERQLLAGAWQAEDQAEQTDRLESGNVRASTLAKFLTALTRQHELERAVVVLSPLLGVDCRQDLSALFVCAREPRPSLPEVLDASGRAHDIDGWLAQLGIPPHFYSTASEVDMHYLKRLDALRLVHAVRGLMAGQFQTLFEPVPMLEVTDSHHAHLCKCFSEFKSERSEGAFAALESAVASLLHVPLVPAFYRFYTMVDDIAARLGKSVRLHVYGDGAASLPRERLSSLSDALVHLLRNALDHGIEPPAERRERGKPELGSVELVARLIDGSLCIQVCDDGRGIDPERVKKKAVETGLIDAQVAAKLSPREAVELVFLPHFSTAGELTEISGRGIGMDVVRESLKQVGGSIAIDTRVGRGTTFTITLETSNGNKT
jgi:PAS domain S-box-containing protein